MAGKTVANPFIGRRIALLRDEMNMRQEDLARELGFANRQTLQQIETGDRKLSVDELTRLIELSGKPFEFFTDPFLWARDGTFSFRAEQGCREETERFEQAAGRWVMLWRWLREVNEIPPGLELNLYPRITARSSYEDVRYFAGRLVSLLDLGDIPALTLATTLESELHIPVLFVDIPDGISGATCHHKSGNVILVNRRDAPGRRNFDLAHEFFHVLTWEQMPPDEFDMETPSGTPAVRRETLANIFASTLLMPENAVRALWSENAVDEMDAPSLLQFVRVGAERFLVSQPAFIRRLVALALIDEDSAYSLLQQADAGTPLPSADLTPPLYSKFYIEHLGRAIDEGRISVRRAASLLHLDVDELAEAYRDHELSVPFDL